ncbi:MAG: hypothetical protein GY861_28915 [bacterium]|nr:hypothetical protein [bacterium]
MVSIFGPSREQLLAFLARHFPELEICAYLADNQHTVGGSDEDCNALLSMLRKEQQHLNIIDVRRLHIAYACHTSFMEPISDKVNKLIDDTDFKRPRIPIILNYSGLETNDITDIKEGLKKQLTAALMWSDSITTAVTNGTRHFVEVSPVRVLSSMIQSRMKICSEHGCTQRFIQV